ncbi:MAG: 16S rRNA (guanine(527)-N(7))-methyltransferase RsmG [Nitrospirae bacterium]|nr:16S rRNA (guanine(527)-N(7))-methyltransferase RsmG [Nitrospirota bacterium]
MFKENVVELLKKGVSELNFSLSGEQIQNFIFYLGELKKWNKTYNLTAILDDREIIIKHFLDSLLYLKALPQEEIKVADIGSGAGLPGIPIKLLRPEIKMFLIEPSVKKTVFLKHVIWELRLKDISVIQNRIEKVRVNYDIEQHVDVAVTRALFSTEDFLKKTSHIIKKNGLLVLNKGPKFKEEIKELKNIKSKIITVSLPLTDIKRNIIVLQLSNPD